MFTEPEGRGEFLSFSKAIALWVDVQITFGIVKMAAVAMETAKMLTKIKTQKRS
jgi:hypothetical protein